jgi:tetrathionate reductase subunit C
MNGQIVELIDITHDISWLPWAVQYFFLIGLSIGAFFLTLPAFVFGKQRLEKLGYLALLVALTCAITAPIALVADLHQPARFYNFYLHSTASSWMSWGSFFLPVYVFSLLVYAWLIYRPGLAAQGSTQTGVIATVSKWLAFGGDYSPGVIRAFGYTTAIGAILVVLYTGAEMAVVSARPLWHTPMLPLLYLSTGLGAAAGLCLLLNRIVGDGDRLATLQLSHYLMAFMGLSLLLQIAWFVSGLGGESASGQAVLRLATEYKPVSFILLWMVGGTLLPLLLAWLKPEKAWWATGLLAVTGAWLFRWNMFIAGQQIPKTGSGFYSYEFPLGHEGLLGMVGSLGLWVFLVLLITTLVPLQEGGKGSTVQSR